jgi:hypothetical protein
MTLFRSKLVGECCIEMRHERTGIGAAQLSHDEQDASSRQIGYEPPRRGRAIEFA